MAEGGGAHLAAYEWVEGVKPREVDWPGQQRVTTFASICAGGLMALLIAAAALIVGGATARWRTGLSQALPWLSPRIADRSS